MLRLARWSTTHRLYVVLGWIALLVAVNAIAQSAGTEYSNNFTLPNSDAQRASDLLQRSFPAQAGDRDTIVYRVSSGNVTDPAVRARMSAMFAEVQRLPHVTSVIGPYAGAAAGKAISANRRIAFATVVFDEKANLLPTSAPERVVAVARAAIEPGLDVELGGQAIEATKKPGFGVSTAVGLLAAIVILLLTFGSLIAMGLPIVTALVGLGTGLGVIALFTHVVDTPNFSSELAAMIGLGVGIDYALFILTRFREAYATPGPTFQDARESVVQAIDTAGRAVLFAGSTVVIALLGMMLLGVDFLYGVAISASIGVLLVMLASLTLLPALLSLAGGRVAAGSRRARRRARARAAESPGASAATTPSTAATPIAADAVASAGSAWLRWSAFVQRRPWSIATVAALAMLVIAAPATALRLGSSDASNDPANQTTHRAYELLAQGFGEGFNGPLLVVAKVPNPKREAVENGVVLTQAVHNEKPPVERLRAAIAATPGVVSVAPAKLNPTGEVATITVYPHSSPQAYATTPAGLAAARTRDPAAGQAHRHDRVRRRRDRRCGGLRHDALPQAAAVHRRGGVAVRAAAAGGVPLAGDPAAGRGDEPAEHRRVAGRDRGDLPVGLAGVADGNPAGADRVVHSGDAVRDRVRAVDGLRGVPGLAHA